MSGDQKFQKTPKILIFIRNYLPGFRSGGPVRSVSNIVKALSSEYEFYVVCLNRDHGVSEPYPNFVRGRWIELGKTQVYYAANDELTFAFYRKIFRDIGPDFIYLNSLLDRDFSIKPFLAAGRGRKVQVILAPRGELSVGALGLKAFRKGIFITLAKAIKFYKYVAWHASSIGEQEQILSIFTPAASQIFHASNLPTISKENPLNREKRPGALRIVLAARISLMKNTHAAIRIAGNHGYDVFLLPTLGENFGHSIIEAMSVGMPVVISNRTPWKNLKDASVGADLPIENEAAFIKQLEDYLDMDEARFDMVRNSCRQYVTTWATESINLDSYRNMFKRVTIFGVDDNLTFKNHH